MKQYIRGSRNEILGWTIAGYMREDAYDSNGRHIGEYHEIGDMTRDRNGRTICRGNGLMRLY